MTADGAAEVGQGIPVPGTLDLAPGTGHPAGGDQAAGGQAAQQAPGLAGRAVGPAVTRPVALVPAVVAAEQAAEQRDLVRAEPLAGPGDVLVGDRGHDGAPALARSRTWPNSSSKLSGPCSASHTAFRPSFAVSRPGSCRSSSTPSRTSAGWAQ